MCPVSPELYRCTTNMYVFSRKNPAWATCAKIFCAVWLYYLNICNVHMYAYKTFTHIYLRMHDRCGWWDARISRVGVTSFKMQCSLERLPKHNTRMPPGLLPETTLVLACLWCFIVRTKHVCLSFQIQTMHDALLLSTLIQQQTYFTGGSTYYLLECMTCNRRLCACANCLVTEYSPRLHILSRNNIPKTYSPTFHQRQQLHNIWLFYLQLGVLWHALYQS